MYKVSPREARTDLYNTGENSDQIFDPSITIHNIDRDAAARERKAAAKAKAEQENQDDIEAQLKSMGGKAIMSHDTPLVAQKSQAVIDYTSKNIDKLKAGDMNARMGFDNIIGDLQTTTAQSVDKRQKVEQTGAMIAANPSKFRQDSVDNFMDFYSSKHAGDMNFNPANYLKENINYNDRVVKELSPFAQRMAQESPLKKVYTKDQANELIASDLEDPHMFDQANYDFNNATDKLGAKTPVEYYQKRYAPKLVVSDTKSPAEWMVNGSSDKRPKVNGTYTNVGNNRGEFQFEYANTTDNPYLTIKDPETGSALEVKPTKVIFGGKTPMLQVATKSSKNEFGDVIPGKTISLDYNSVSDIMHNKFGIENVYDIKEGKPPKNVTVKYSDTSNKNALKKGDERAVQDGTAIFNGTKWVMK